MGSAKRTANIISPLKADNNYYNSAIYVQESSNSYTNKIGSNTNSQVKDQTQKPQGIVENAVGITKNDAKKSRESSKES